ncbi:hypothetical protein COB72_00175 [bacterium]|nr:MAG: hypothetical protein COB72_00175 [bacterium]
MFEYLNNSQSPVHLDRCEHGKYHLTIADTTLRLSALEVRYLTQFMVNAAHHFSVQLEADSTREYLQHEMPDRFKDDWTSQN